MSLETFLSRVDRSGDCWEWKGHISKQNGYGQWSEVYPDDTQKMKRPHRYILEVAGVNIEGQHIHHRCGNRKCLRPGHLEVMTPAYHQRQLWLKDYFGNVQQDGKSGTWRVQRGGFQTKEEAEEFLRFGMRFEDTPSGEEGEHEPV